jgi:hypothetical protein
MSRSAKCEARVRTGYPAVRECHIPYKRRFACPIRARGVAVAGRSRAPRPRTRDLNVQETCAGCRVPWRGRCQASPAGRHRSTVRAVGGWRSRATGFVQVQSSRHLEARRTRTCPVAPCVVHVQVLEALDALTLEPVQEREHYPIVVFQRLWARPARPDAPVGSIRSRFGSAAGAFLSPPPPAAQAPSHGPVQLYASPPSWVPPARRTRLQAS